MSELTAETYPLMPLRDIVLFPGMVAPLVVGQKEINHGARGGHGEPLTHFSGDPERRQGG